MKLSECYITIKTLMKHPQGLTLEELSEKIREDWPTESATMWLTVSENSGLRILIEDELICINRVNGKYYFNPDSEHYYHDKGMIDEHVRKVLAGENLNYEKRN